MVASTLPALTVSDAEISGDGLYRYTLRRLWGPPEIPPLVVAMLNPSDASEIKNDPTVSTLIRFASGDPWRGERYYSGIVVVNLFTYRTSKPAALLEALLALGPEFVIGPDNRRVIEEEIIGGRDVMVAWGNSRVVGTIEAQREIDHLLWCAEVNDCRVLCRGVTADGQPKHPMARGKHRIPYDAPLVPWVRP